MGFLPTETIFSYVLKSTRVNDLEVWNVCNIRKVEHHLP